MFTVLIAEKEHIDAIQRDNKLFFEPFLENKELAFCEWIPGEQSLADSVPGLLDAVGRKKEWRVVILNNVDADALKTRNPFDTADLSALTALAAPSRQPAQEQELDKWEESWKTYLDESFRIKESVCAEALRRPLQKLATWLCFKPEDYILNEVQEKQDVHDWAMEMLGRDDVKPSVRLELLERAQYKRELRMKETLRRAFMAEASLNIAQPIEVHCISLRTAENSFFDPQDYWNVRQASAYSTFADRNMFFDRMRFMVFDLLPAAHRNYRTDYIRFLASVLIFITNPAPGSAMQARHLYRLEVETDDTPLCTLVTSYDKKLAATWDVIESEMEKIRSEIPDELTDKAAEELFCTPQSVSVLLDESCDPEKVYADKDYGLFFDSPQDEFHKWNRSVAASEKTLAHMAKQQSRAVRKSVSQLHMSSEVTDVNISRLTPLQVDDIRDYTDTAEDEMIASIPPDLTDIAAYTARMEKESENVKKIIEQRMTQKTTLILSGICLGLLLACFLPFLFSNSGTPKTVTTAVMLVAGMLGLLAVILAACLLYLRSTLVSAVNGYNRVGREIVNEIQTALKRFSKYLSASCNVRRGHAVQNYARKNLDEYTKGLRIRKKHQEDIRKRRAFLAEDYGDYFGDAACCDETMSRPYDYDFDQTREYDYPAPFLAGDCRQIEFLSSGNFVEVPSSYVTRILVRMEGLYEQ